MKQSVRRALGFVLPCLVAAVAMDVSNAPLRAADPQPYTVQIAKTSDSGLNTAIAGSSQLEALREKAPVGPFALVARARQDTARFETALHSFGYYKGQVVVTVNGRGLDDPELPTLLQQQPASPPAKVDVAFRPGPQFQIRDVRLTGSYPAELLTESGLKVGQPAIAAQIIAARDQMLSQLRNHGYALAKVDLQPATLYPAANAMVLTFHVDSGPRVNIGPITFQGLDGVNESFARRVLPLHEGQLFSADAIDKARSDLASTPIFASVVAVPATQLDANGQLPITIFTTERPLHAVDVGASYSTDLGVGLTAGWHQRNLFGNGEQLNLTGAIQAGGNSQIRPGYKVNAQLIKPAFLDRDQSLEVNVGAVDQSLIAYDQKALLQSAIITRQLSPHWRFSYGLSGEEEDITQEGVSRTYNLAGVPLGLRYDSTDNLLNPTQGIRSALLVTPELSLSKTSSVFTITQLSGSTYLNVLGNGRTILALRGLVGDISGASQFGVPPDQRFYAGGSGTVRGYKYQSVGPQFPDGKPQGGTEITAGTVELRQRIGQSFGFSVFTDAARVSAPGAPTAGRYAVGAGLGAQYYTSFGPIRAEFALPVVRLPNSGSFEIYVGLGQAF